MRHASRDTGRLQLLCPGQIRPESTLKDGPQALFHFVEAPNKRPPSPAIARGWLLTWGCMTLLLSACPESSPDRSQGYVEGEFVYVASPLGGSAGETRRGTRRAGEEGRYAV